ncbi:Peptide methionine sulfoxide reductase MsrA 2 [Planctomycetes bacterium MalM25]|nr:Peptide methionine sulfoxide reductase MsrA 2 [Planctomycetes bacterium MalM25]
MTRRLALPITTLAAAATLGALLTMSEPVPAEPFKPDPPASRSSENGQQLATFGGGCFWCTEAVFDATEGVHAAVSGYAGGRVINPTYEAVCSGTTGHAEVIQVTYDPAVISYKDLLQIFFRTHDPTTLNQQGADRGTQYRSVIYFHDDAQRAVAEEVKAALDASGAFRGPIVTELSPLDIFYPAEAYHQDYFARNPAQGYCRAVIAPKMEKYRKAFADKLKSE